MASASIEQADLLLTEFADRTGLTSHPAARRYLWTDAFAVCTMLGLRRSTGEARFQELALRLVDRVHHELGRHRRDDRRVGWISGLTDAEGDAHPTKGGLRIGKPLPERADREPLEPDLEWDRDGQYFNYLTQWMHALDQATRATGRPVFNAWARELADVAHRAFTYGERGAKRIRWKLSIDLSRPLASSMGQHDALDAFVTCKQLEATAVEMRQLSAAPSLAVATKDFADMIDAEALTTFDPLGIGSLLVDALRLVQLGSTDRELVASVLAAAARGLRQGSIERDLQTSSARRVAFRELGLAIGLAAVSQLVLRARTAPALEGPARATLAELVTYVPLRSEIQEFWLRPEHRRTSTWLAHGDLDDVMLAASLAPDGLLVRAPIQPGPAARAAAGSELGGRVNSSS